jgi:hypothetical protein
MLFVLFKAYDCLVSLFNIEFSIYSKHLKLVKLTCVLICFFGSMLVDREKE